MPSDVVKSLAKKSGKTVAEVETIWEEAKEETDKKYGRTNKIYWAYVTSIVKKRLGIKD